MKNLFHRNVTLVSSLIVISWFIYFCPAISAHRSSRGSLFPACVEGQGCGYINETGKFEIEPSFEDAGDFKEGLARVQVAGKWGFIDETGTIVIKPTFDGVEDFSEGLAAVRRQVKSNILWGYIDKTGASIIEPIFGLANAFSSGRAVIAAQKGNKCGVIDRQGQFIVKPRYKYISNYSEGLAAIQIGEKFGYIDPEGRVLIKPKWSGYGKFSEGLALVSLGKRRQGYIDKTGQVIISLAESSEGGDFSEGLAPVSIRAGIAECGYIDKTGKMVTQANFASCSGFSEGLAVVKFNDAMLHARYIDKTGRVIISTPFTRVSAFRGALAPVYDGGIGLRDQGYIDRSGNVVWKPIFRKPPVLHF